MPQGSYSLPFRPEEILEGREHPREARIEKAIGDLISLVLRTAPGESSGDPHFGCRIWDHLAEPIRGESWLARLKEDVRISIVENEPRLKDVTVELKPTRSESNDLTLEITGRIVPSDRLFTYSRIIFIDPIRIT